MGAGARPCGLALEPHVPAGLQRLPARALTSVTATPWGLVFF